MLPNSSGPKGQCQGRSSSKERQGKGWKGRSRQHLSDWPNLNFADVVAFQTEEALLRQGRMRVAEGAGQKLCWNAREFRVGYPSLASQLCIGGVYVRLLLDGVDQVMH